MSKKRSVPGPDQNWHFDCRLEAELPEDNVIGSRFLVNVLCGSLALVFLLVAGWFGYRDLGLRRDIRDWESRLSQSELGIREIKQDQIQFSVEATKIDQAYAVMKSEIFFTGFLADIGAARPPEMDIDVVEGGDNNAVFIRGSIHAPPVIAGDIFKDFTRKLQANAAITAAFEGVRQNSLNADIRMSNKSNFEIALQRRVATQ